MYFIGIMFAPHDRRLVPIGSYKSNIHFTLTKTKERKNESDTVMQVQQTRQVWRSFYRKSKEQLKGKLSTSFKI